MDLPNVLFVESQGQGLSNLSSSAADEWQSLYVNEAEAALDIMSQRRISVIVANFGAEINDAKLFFQKVWAQAGPTIQIILLLNNVNDEIDDSFDYVHLCISSHCEPTEVIKEIQRGLTIWEQIKDNDALASLIIKLNKLPTPPAIYFDLRDEFESSNCNTESLANIIARDQAITVKLLKVVNSGFYATPRSIVELKQAISFLGIELVLGLVLTAYLFDSLPLPGINLDNLWKHNLTVSALAKHIAKELGGDRDIIDASGVAGLLHDLGSLILLANLPTQYHTIIRQSMGDESVLLPLEYEHFGAAHPEIGALALKLCNLPDNIIEAVALHHQQPEQADMLTAKAVLLAEWLVNAYALHGGDYSESFDCEGIEENILCQVEGWWNKCGQIAESIQS